MAEWFEDFFGGLYGKVLARQFDETRWVEQARLVKRLLGVRKGARVLDIPCGQGRLTLPLARMGLVMTGVDFTPMYLRRARRRTRQQGLDIRYIQSDMRRITFDGEFEAAFNWWGSFGYFSDADNLAFCQRVFQALRPGGRFLVDGPNRSRMLRHFSPCGEQDIEGVHISRRTRFVPGTGRALSRWTLTKGDVTERKRISMKIFNGAEIRSLLRAAGFREIALYGWPPAGRFTRHSRRLVAVGRRPKK